MPEMDGHEAAAAIHAPDWPDAKTIPIYAMTANRAFNGVPAACQYGALSSVRLLDFGKAMAMDIALLT